MRLKGYRLVNICVLIKALLFLLIVGEDDDAFGFALFKKVGKALIGVARRT